MPEVGPAVATPTHSDAKQVPEFRPERKLLPEPGQRADDLVLHNKPKQALGILQRLAGAPPSTGRNADGTHAIPIHDSAYSRVARPARFAWSAWTAGVSRRSGPARPTRAPSLKPPTLSVYQVPRVEPVRSTRAPFAEATHPCPSIKAR